MLKNDYCVSVDLDSPGFPGVCPSPGLTSSTPVLYVCARAYTSTHPPTSLTLAKIGKYIRHNLYLYSAKTSSSTSATSANHGQAEKDPTSKPFLHTHVGVEKHV